MTAKISELPAEKLRRVCDPREFTFKSIAELPELSEIIGQERATRAIEFGIDIRSHGYNIYALGPAGAGKTTTIMTFLERKTRARPVPHDWAYVNNFEDTYRPRTLILPPGGGEAFRNEVDELLKSLEDEIPRAFESEEYQEHKARLTQQLEERRRAELQRLEASVIERGFALLQTPMGLVIAPVVASQVLTGEQYEQLSSEKKHVLEQDQTALQGKLERTLRQVRELEKEGKTQLRGLDQETIAFTIGHYFDTLQSQYVEYPAIVAYLKEVRHDIIQNVEWFKTSARVAEENSAGKDIARATSRLRQGFPFDRYRINVIVDNSGLEGAPVILETNPTYRNLVGRVEHRSEFGALVTDFSMIKGGALHRANGGYLVLDARAILRDALAWEALKRVLRHGEVRIEEMGQQLSPVATVGLEPEPVPLDVKVVLIGDPQTYYLLYAMDDQFQKLFKVWADFATEMAWSQENVEKYTRFIRARCEAEDLRDFDLEAVAKVVEYGSRLVEDQQKLTTRFAHIADIVREASYWASRNGNNLVTAADVENAIEEKIYRSNRVEEKIRELIEEGTILVSTRGEVVGQVNGLFVLSLGDYSFGKPSRITAKTYLGRAGVINIERKAKLSGNIHDKGVLILSGYLGGKYAQEVPLSLTASLCFEQSYEGVEGDSASSTELYAVLSSLSGLPIKQGIAVTGSVNQQGEIQPVAGVTKKIEGFFDVCQAQGLTGEQGVIIPERNVKNLMLREDVVEAVKRGEFHIYPVVTIDEGIAILTGEEAGERGEDGMYPEGTVNYKVDQRLRELAMKLKAFTREAPQQAKVE